MKGKKVFTQTEANQIIALIEQKVKADSNTQKSIRNKIRRLGFYASDFGIGGGYTVQDFKRVATISGQKKPGTAIKSILKKETATVKTKAAGLNISFGENIKKSLETNGFKGFKTVRALIDGKYKDIPEVRGIYVLLKPSKNPEFVNQGTGGFHKGEDPNVSIDTLKKNWVEKADVIYIGKAGAPDKETHLRKRLSTYFRFGQGKPAGHKGGRYVWQLKNCYDIVVCWKELPTGDPREEEAKLIQAFKEKYKMRPFANLVD